MTIALKIITKPNSKKTEIVSDNDGILIITIKSPPEKGKANQELVKFLSKHFKRKVEIISGFKSKRKILKNE